MTNEITDIQKRYLSALIKNTGQAKYKEIQKKLRLSKPIPTLTKDEAYQLITHMVSESSGDAIEKALKVALEREDV